MAKSYFVKGKSAIISHNLILIPNKKTICIYLYYYLNSIRLDLMKLPKYNSGLGHITKKQYENIKILVPSKKDQEKVVEMIEQINKEESDYNQMLQNMKQMIQTIYDSVETLECYNTTRFIEL